MLFVLLLPTGMIRDEEEATFIPMGLQYCEESTFSSLKKKRISPIHHKT